MGNREKCVYIIPAFLDQIDCRSQFDCLWPTHFRWWWYQAARWL